LLNQSKFLRSIFPSNAWLRHWLIINSCLSIVCTEEERSRLSSFNDSKKIAVIPHYIEDRLSLPSREESRRILGFERFKVITLLGFIFEGKGHKLLIESLALLKDKKIMVVFAGGSAIGSEGFLNKLKCLAEKKGVSAQLKITGYLEEKELEKYLVSTDIAVCPYSLCFASSSLATWFSVARPIIASYLPQFREYDKFYPGAIHFFSPYSSKALAKSIKKLFASYMQTSKPFNAK